MVSLYLPLSLIIASLAALIASLAQYLPKIVLRPTVLSISTTSIIPVLALVLILTILTLLSGSASTALLDVPFALLLDSALARNARQLELLTISCS